MSEIEIVWSGFFYKIVCVPPSMSATNVAARFRKYRIEENSPSPCPEREGHKHYHLGVTSP